MTAKLGVADGLRNGTRDAAALAAEAGAGPSSLRRVLRTLASIGVFTETADGQFGLTPLGKTLTQDSPSSMRDLAIMWMETHYGPFGGLIDGVRTGQSAASSYYGQPFFDWLGGQPEQVDRLSLAAGDFFAAVPGGADTYLLSMILHDWSDAEASRLIDLTMLGMLNGRERTRDEHRLLLQDAGFTLEDVTPTPTPISVIRARA